MVTLARRGAIAASGGAGGGTQLTVGSFTKQNTTGTQAITGVGFTPKAIIFWTSGSAAASGTWEPHIGQGIGFTSGPSESYAVAGSSEDAVGTSNTVRGIAAKAIHLQSPTAGVEAGADLTSFDADGFTLDWTQNSVSAFVASSEISYLAIGGADVSAKVVNWTSPTSAPATKEVTGVGFQPDVVLHAATPRTAVGSEGFMSLGFGAMDAAGGQWTNAVAADDAETTSDTYRYQRTDKCIAFLTPGGSTVDEEAAFNSMTADGFEVTFSTADANTFQYISLCLSGVEAKVGNFTTPASTGNDAQTGIGFEPGALLATSYETTPQTTVQTNGRWAMGAADASAERVIGQVDNDGQGTTFAKSVWFDNYTIIGAAEAAGSALESWRASFSSFDSDGFTLNFDKVPGSAAQVLYLALA